MPDVYAVLTMCCTCDTYDEFWAIIGTRITRWGLYSTVLSLRAKLFGGVSDVLATNKVGNGRIATYSDDRF